MRHRSHARYDHFCRSTCPRARGCRGQPCCTPHPYRSIISNRWPPNPPSNHSWTSYISHIPSLISPVLSATAAPLFPIDPQFGTTLSAQSLAVRTFRSSTVLRSLSMRSFGHLIWLGDCRHPNLAIYDQATYFYSYGTRHLSNDFPLIRTKQGSRKLS